MSAIPTCRYNIMNESDDTIADAHPRFSLAMPGKLHRPTYQARCLIRHIHFEWLIASMHLDCIPSVDDIDSMYTLDIQLGPSQSLVLDVLFHRSCGQGEFFQILNAPIQWTNCVKALSISTTAQALGEH